MKREFKKAGAKRYVLAKIFKHTTFHPECAPEGSSDFWAWTSHSCCGKCHESLYKEVKP